MAAHVLHIGMDDCHRVAVLRSAGYAVDEYASMPELAEALGGIPDLDAVLFSESENIAPEVVFALARECSAEPVIFFNSSNRRVSTPDFDLVIPPLTPPEKWLKQVSTLIERSRVLRAQGKSFADKARPLGLDTSMSRRPPVRERELSSGERMRLTSADSYDSRMSQNSN